LGFAALSANLLQRRAGSDAPRKPRPAGGRFDRAPGDPRRDGGFKPGGKPGEFKPGGKPRFCVGKDLRRDSGFVIRDWRLRIADCGLRTGDQGLSDRPESPDFEARLRSRRG
jgi:hypothetical protein